MKPTGGQENGISECIDSSHDTRNVLEMRENEKRFGMGSVGVRPVFEAKPAPAPHGSGANPVSGFGGTRQAFDADQ